MKNKATHKGTCQVCGNLQKLPNGRLSTHGYTVRCGFFEGVCWGAGALPFEQDISLIEGSIARAIDKAASIRETQASLRAEVAEGVTTAWANVYFPYSSKWLPSRYEWVQVTVTSEFRKYSDAKTDADGYTTFSRSKVEGEFEAGAHNRVIRGEGKTIAEVCRAMNSKKADSLDKVLAEIAKYVAWQKARIANWAPSELKPLTK